MKKIFLIMFILSITLCLGGISYSDLNFGHTEIGSFLDYSANRTAGSQGEKTSAEYIENKLSSFGLESLYENFQQTFSYDENSSQNVLAIKRNSSEKYVIIGSHYDAIFKLGVSEGVNDNASGVITNLLLAEYFSSQNLSYNLIFAFFGAEEEGFLGSQYFLDNLNENIKENILLYINLDSIGAGKNLYYYHYDQATCYGNFIDKTLNEKVLKLGYNKLFSNKSTLGTSYYHIGMLSDNMTFLKQGINSLNFFAGDLNSSDFGFHEIDGQDKIMHKTDSLETIGNTFGESFYSNMQDIYENIIILLTSDNFESAMQVKEINPIVLTDWFLKLVAGSFVLVLMLLTIIFFKIKAKLKLTKVKQ